MFQADFRVFAIFSRLINSRQENRSKLSFYSQTYNYVFFETSFLSSCGQKMS